MSRSRRVARSGALLAILAACVAGLAGAGVAPTTHGPARIAPAFPGGGQPGGGAGGPANQGAGGAVARPLVAQAVRHDRSAPLRTLKPVPPVSGEGREEDGEQEGALPGRDRATAAHPVRDPVLQAAPVAGADAPAVDVSFEGLSNVNGALPPDTNGDIGPNHYVQWVNVSFAIYDRSGTLLYGPAAGDTLWAGFGGPCEATNDGDPIALYDQLADRWLMSQFALPGFPDGPFYQCLAVSATPDPTGAWNRYEFLMSGTKLNDYPKFGVWPDAYYMSVNQFSGADLSTWAGQGVVAFDRAAMLAGDDATMVSFDLYDLNPNLGTMLPSDLDGPIPPSGAPNLFMEFDDDAWGYSPDQLDLWAFHVDWATPANATFSHRKSITTAAVDSNLCDYDRTCIPQPGQPPRGVDALADRLMYRLQYRNFGDHQTLVVNHTVDVNGADRAGIRWYELRNSGSGWSIRQQGTYSPDATNRWLGSAAMDANGNIALGYSVSSASVYPSIRYTGRLASDPLGTMGLGEGTLIAGTGRQTNLSGRWGDYAMLAVDPVDDCTFWFTSEYYATSGDRPWRTRIASFRMPDCGPDVTPPTVTTPKIGLRSGITYTGGLKAVLTWTGSDLGVSGIASYDVERSVDGGPFSVLASGLSSPSHNVTIAKGHTYRFAVRAHDGAGNVGDWLAGATTSRLVRQDTSGQITYHGTWHVARKTAYAAGSVHYATAAGASARLTFTGRSVAFVTTTGSGRGKVRVYLGGNLVATLDLFSGSVAYRQVVWSRTWANAGSHTLKLVVVGTAGRPRIDLDALLILK